MLYLYVVKSQLPSDGKVNNIVLRIHRCLTYPWNLWERSIGVIESNEQPIEIKQIENRAAITHDIDLNRGNVNSIDIYGTNSI
jgi:hypothetical protein